MALLKYFKIDKRHSSLPLPDPYDPLNQHLSANKEVTEVLCYTRKLQTYLKVLPNKRPLLQDMLLIMELLMQLDNFWNTFQGFIERRYNTWMEEGLFERLYAQKKVVKI